MSEVETLLSSLRWLGPRWYSDLIDELVARIEDAARDESPALPWLLNAGHMLIGSRGAHVIEFTEDAAPAGVYAKLHQLLLRSADWQDDLDAHLTAVTLRKAASHVARAQTVLTTRK